MANDMAITISPTPGPAGVFQLETLDKQYSTGFYKLIMQWVKCLLTSPGSSVTDHNYGTSFGALLGSSVSSPDVSTLLSKAVSDATAQIRTRQLNTPLPTAEKLAGTQLVSLTSTSADSYSVRVEITNVAGDSLALVLPSNLLTA